MPYQLTVACRHLLDVRACMLQHAVRLEHPAAVVKPSWLQACLESTSPVSLRYP